MTVSARIRAIRTALVAAALFVSSLASALTVTGGDTRVAFDADALGGLTAGVTGSATVIGPGLTVNFPITGGFLDAALAGEIRHDGSGITLSNGINTLALGNAAKAPAVAAIPEPGTWLMLIVGFGNVGVLARRTRPAPLQTV